MEEINSRSILIVNEAKNNAQKYLMDFVLKPIFAGVLGFLLFMLVIGITKFLGYCCGTIKVFTLDIDDVILSGLGFLLLLLIKLLENFHEKNN